MAIWFTILFCAITATQAQTNDAEIIGTVKDSSGGVLPDVTMVAENQASGFRLERVTDGSGKFLFPALPAGEYNISASHAGFKRYSQNGLVLQIGQVLRLELTLQSGDITEEINITASEASLQTTSAEVSDVIEHQRIVELPLNGRQFLQLALLSEGVIKPPGGTRGAAMQQAGDLVNVAGQRSGHNIYMLDGVKITDEYFNNMAVSPSVDAIREFKIQKSMYAAEFGGKASALIQVATKSGTNEYHGSLFEFLRNDAFDAKNFFDDPRAPIPPFRQNQFGGSLGGPFTIPKVYEGKNRSFFFVNYEGQRIRKSVTKTFSVPSAAVRAGDFSGLPPIYDPATTAADGTRSAFADNRIPADRVDPIAMAFMSKIPLPNRPGNVQNLITALKEITDVNQFNLRLDHQLTDRDRLFGRLTAYRARALQPYGSSQLDESLVPGFGRELTTRTYNVALSHTHTFTNNVLNEFRFGWLGVSGGQASLNQGVDFASSAGLQGVTEDPRDVGYPQVTFGGLYGAMGDPVNIITRNDQSYEFFDNVLIQHGAHKIKFGGYFFYLKFRPSNPEAARGVLAFTNRWTSSQAGLTDGNAFADFLLGAPSSAQVGIGRGDEDARTNWLHFYGQDDWEVTPSLTANVGLRYEINQQMRAVDNRLSAIDLTAPGGRFVIASDGDGRINPAANALLPLIPISHVTSAEAGWDRGLLQPSYNRIAPRLGAAWKAPWKHDTVVRAGFGIYLNQWAYGVQQALARNLPFFLVKNVNVAADALSPTATTANILNANAIGSIGGNNMDHDYRIEYNEAWSLSIQHLLTQSTMIEAVFLGSRTVGADNSTVRNVPLPGPGPIDARRPIPSLSNFNSIRWDGWSTYNALTLKLERRLAGGLAVNGNYTWSKSIDDASDPGGTAFESNLPQNVYDLPSEKALSSFDHRHRFVASFVYELPLGRGISGWKQKALTGWQTSGIISWYTGAPFTVNLGVDRANVGAGPAQRPNVLRNPNLSGGRSPELWFDTAAFILPAAFTFGNAGRNIVYAPGYSDVDFSLQKETGLTERARLKFRVEAFNLFNHPNFDAPNRTAFTPNFGRIFSADAPRQLQFCLKIEF
ncbi:MAG TPA: TonB-dependent receptor [Blastocatellia bacterium]|nr:TonB-dependent receptor [Blastocatellia bacterium]